MWSFAFLSLLVGLAAASNNAWKSDTKYEYRVSGRTLTGLSDISSEYSGILLKATLTVQPKNDGSSLIGQVTDGQYARIFKSLPDGWDSHIPSAEAQFRPIPWSGKPFEIKISNSVIKDLIVDSDVSEWEANMLKSIVSQLQVDTEGRSLVQSHINQLPEEGRNSAVYKTMEETITGKYETLYEINPLPEYALQLEPYLVPFQSLKGDDMIEVIKTKNFSNAEQRSGYFYGLGQMENADPASNQLGDLMSRSSLSRVILSGNLHRYTIQHSVTTNKISIAPALFNNQQKGMVISQVNISLVNMQESSEQPQEPANPKPLGGLVYVYEGRSHLKRPSHVHDNFASYNYYKSDEDSSSSSEGSHENYKHLSEEHDKEDEEFASNAKPKLNEVPYSPLLPYYNRYKEKAAKAVEICNEIAKELQNLELISEKQTLAKYIILTTLIRTLNEQEIEQVAQSLYTKDDRSVSGDAWKAYRDTVIASGTGPAFLNIQKWILSGKLQNDEAAEAMSAIAQSVREPTDDFIRTYYQFSTTSEVQSQSKLNVTALLSLSELISEVYFNKEYSSKAYPADVFGSFRTKSGRKFVLSEYIPYLNAKLRTAVAAADSHKIQVYISALGLIGHPSVLAAYEPFLEGYEQISQFQRLHMVYSLERLVRNYPSEARSVLYKIYQNARENPDVRIAAVYLLIKTGPSPAMLQRMADFTNIDKNEQVNSAVKSIIQHVAQLNSTEYKYTIDNARSAKRHLLNRQYEPRYSHFYKKLYGKQESENFQYVASEDSYLPKAFRLSYRYNDGGYSRQYFNLQSSVSSVSEIARALTEQFQEYLEQMERQKKNTGENQWSSENVVEALNINVDEREQTEGNLIFKLGGYKRLFTVDNHTMEALPKVLQEALEALRDGKPFRFTKYFNRYEIEMSYPTEMAWPLVFFVNAPTVLTLDGTTKLNVQPELSNGKKLRVPETIQAEGDLTFLLSSKVEGRVGFYNPYDHQQYVSGYEKDTQLYLPIKHNVKVDLNNKQIRAELSFKNPEKSVKLAHHTTRPYIAHFDILEFSTALSHSDTQIVGSQPKSYYNVLYGQKSTGMAFRLKYKGDDKFLAFRWFHDQIKHAKNYASIAASWESQNLGVREVSFEYAGEQSQNKEVKANFLYYKNAYDTPQTQNVDVQQVYNAPKNANERLEDFGKKASAGVINANVVGLHASINFEGAKPTEYDATAVYSSSKVDATSRALFYYGNGDEAARFRIAASLKNHFPSLNEMDPEKVLQSDISSTIQANVVFGNDFQSGTHLDGQVKMRRSDERTQYLKHSREYKRCEKEMRVGNKQLYDCEQLTSSAMFPDSIVTQWQYNNLDERTYSFTAKVYSWFRYFNFYNSVENYANNGNEKEGEVNVNVDFYPDYSAVNASLKTHKYGAFYENIKLEPEYVLEKCPVSYWALSHFPKLNWHRPTCVVDKNSVKTYDNLTLEAELSDAWTVAMVHVPLHARNAEYVNKRLHNYMEARNNYAIFVRESGSEQKEIKIYLRTPETKNNEVVIDLKPEANEQNPTLLIDNQPQRYSEKQIAKSCGDYIQVYALAQGEVKVDIQDEFSVIYDGSRIKIRLYNDRYYDELRGICGNANTLAADDLRAPENCALRTSQELVDAYTIPEGASAKNPKHNEYKSGCYPYKYVYANVISHDQLEHNNPNFLHRGSKGLRSCSRQQTRYTVNGDEVCFTIRPLPQCQSSCSPTKLISKSVPVHCVKKTNVSQLWMKSIDKGASPDFGLKKATKDINFEVPQSCRQN